MTLLLRRVARHVLDVVGHGWELATDALARLEAELELHRAWGYTGRVQGCEQWQGPQSLNGGRPLPYAGRYSSPACCTCTSGVICSLPALVPSCASRVRGRGRSRRTSGHCTFKRRAAPVLVYYLVIDDVHRLFVSYIQPGRACCTGVRLETCHHRLSRALSARCEHTRALRQVVLISSIIPQKCPWVPGSQESPAFNDS